MQKLPRTFYDRDTEQVARDLLGAFIVHRVDGVERIAKIVETEAYLGAHDLASHSSKGITKRTRIMYGPPGFAYVYLIYGMHHCMNIVTEREGCGAAVLLRAAEPVANISLNTRGPGLLCKALGITLSQNGCDLLGDDLHLLPREKGAMPCIVERPRIGVDYAGEWAVRPLRFYIEGNGFISRK